MSLSTMRSRLLGGTAWAAVGLLSLCVPVAGCGGDPCSVGGQVNLDGQPVEEGTIRLDPIEGTAGRTAVAPIQGGEYQIPQDGGLRPGKHQVLILATRAASGAPSRTEPSPGHSDPKGKPLHAAGRDNIVQQDAVLELVPGQNTKDFDLRSDGSVWSQDGR